MFSPQGKVVNDDDHEELHHEQEQYIAAIDFGTSRSGASVGQAGNLQPHRLQIVAPPGGVDLSDHKILTSIALDKHGEVHGFGYNAREAYYHQPDKLYLFENYKMALKDLGRAGRRKVVKASNGVGISLMKVITKTLECFKKEVLEHIESRNGRPVQAHDVKWVLTVPAIWSDQAKDFMREAAYHAGMTRSQGSDNLKLCLEPEGACLSTHFDTGLVDFGVGNTFIVVDAGGGTIDITGHQIVSLNPFRLKNEIVPRGNQWGSTMIDKEFCNFLREVLGVEDYTKLYDSAFFHADVMAKFDIKKVDFDRRPNTDVYINLSGAITLGIVSADLQPKVARFNQRMGPASEGPWVTAPGGGMLVLSPRLMRSFFEPALEQTVELVQEVRGDMPGGCDKILLVGGFGASKLLRQRMREVLPCVTIKTPENSSLATVRGALYFATEECMTTRKAKYTYAVSYSEKFNRRNKRHQPLAHKTYKAKRQKKEQEEDRVDLLLPLVGRGEDIPVGYLSERKPLWPLLTDQTEISFTFYGVDADRQDVLCPNPRDQLGEVTVKVDMSRPFEERGLDIQLEFDTEIRPRVFDHETNRRIDDNKVSLQMMSRGSGGGGGSVFDFSDDDDETDGGHRLMVAGNSAGTVMRRLA